VVAEGDRDRTPRSRRTPPSAPAWPAGSSCSGSPRRRSPRRPPRPRPCRRPAPPSRVGQVPGGGQAVDAGADHQMARWSRAAPASAQLSAPGAPSPRAPVASSRRRRSSSRAPRGRARAGGNLACGPFSRMPYELPEVRCAISTFRAISFSRPSGIGK
jgi:hypothetical protein